MTLSLDEPLVVSSLAEIEIAAALWRKHRLGELAAEDAALLAGAAGRDVHGVAGHTPPFAVVAVTPPVLRRAAHLVAVHPLRAYDALQLATALEVRDVTGCVRLACFDRALARAAVAEGLSIAG